ncbi:MAG: hydantoinase/oxoprolinase family protein, partial [Vicinamibacterales bacterium]
NGGLVSAATARSAAVHTLLSGPAAGAVGALAVAKASGSPTAIAFDMGGTSTDVSWLDQAMPFTSEGTVGGWPVRVPMVDIHTVGAGGGSIAYLDTGGALRVGPRSAGADPGPACYGRSDLFTVTDANLLLGRLHADSFLGGTMPLDRERARAAAETLAHRAGLQPHTLAAGVVRIANANMERAIRVVSVHRGHDPRDAALVAFGGAGGMHACELATALNVKTVVVPRFAGVLSAFGMLQADVTRDYLSTVLRRLEGDDASELAFVHERLEAVAHDDLVKEGISRDRIELERLADLRYVGQSYEISVGLGPGVRERFHAEHRRRYGHDAPQHAIECVSARVRARGILVKASLPTLAPAIAAPVPIATHTTWFNGRGFETPVFDLDALGSGVASVGPALLAGASATVVIPPRVRYDIDSFGNVTCHLPARRSRS